MDSYILVGKIAVKCADISEWKAWFPDADRCVAKTKKDGIQVSTVFLGIDHSFGDGPRCYLKQ